LTCILDTSVQFERPVRCSTTPSSKRFSITNDASASEPSFRLPQRYSVVREDAVPDDGDGLVKTQTVLPSADTAAMLFWALLASGQINMRKIDGWQTLATKPIDQPIDLAA